MSVIDSRTAIMMIHQLSSVFSHRNEIVGFRQIALFPSLRFELYSSLLPETNVLMRKNNIKMNEGIVPSFCSFLKSKITNIAVAKR